MRAALQAAGYSTPTPIQAGTIAPALAGHDLVGAAQTGTGKTAAFIIPVVERLHAARRGGEYGCALVLAPTRELAEQTHGWAQRLGCGLPTALVVGGVAYGPQISALRRRPAIIVATPGRLVDHLERRTLALAQVRILVLDEADRMLDMGFRPQLDRIMQTLPVPRQTLLFSATLPPDLGAIARMHLRSPVRVEAGRQALPPQRATQDVYLVAHENKTPLLLSLIGQNAGNVLVFARTKHRTDRLARSIRNAGHAVERLHADRSQSQRREALAGFRSGRYRILVATDIAARGIDVAGIGRVINYDLPQTAEDYVHRVGRTARAEADGHASSFAAPEERAQLHAIERHLGRALPRQAHADACTPTAAAPPRFKEVHHGQERAVAPIRSRAVGYDSRYRRARQG
ncbi:MAG: DEAD/DEAH box helicase [Deltaproteobacteria bacterium]|nr:DEAD/DEAH box helicase [Deltaproteobacteria bacterium]